jgi:aldose sugar dehydrogenase
MPPIWTNNAWSQGSSSAAFLEGEAWGNWDGAMVIGLMGIGFGGTPIGQRIECIRQVAICHFAFCINHRPN